MALTTLESILLVIVGGGAVAVAFHFVKKSYIHLRDTIHLGAAPKLIAGQIRVCEAMVIEIAKLREAVEKFTSVVVAGGPQPPDTSPTPAAYQPYDEEEADKAFLTQTFMAGGMTEEEAKIRAELEKTKQVLSPAGE